jgi:hypothetical protein
MKAGSDRMKIPTLPFTVTDWSGVPSTIHLGETAQTTWRTFTIGDLSDRRRSEPIRPAAAGLNPRAHYWARVEWTSWCEPRVSPAVAIGSQVGDFLLRSWLLSRYDRHTDRRDRIKLEPTA